MLDILSAGEGLVRTSDGSRIFYRATGQGRRTLLFMHGWGGNGSGSFWTPLMRSLDVPDSRLVVVDLRGHGRSERARTGYTTERFAQDMFEIADHLKTQELILVAYSMSGRWAQWMACAQPARVAGQVLIGPVPASAMQLPPELADTWIEAISTRERYFQFETQFTKIPLTEDVLDDCFQAARGVSETALRETLRMCTHPGFTERLAVRPVPTLVIGGTHDPMITPDYLRTELLDKIPGARLVQLECGHNVPLEMPRETAAAVQEFVATLPSQQSPHYARPAV